jgi:hypothetical protein
MKLNNSNYFSDEANWQYMSASQFKSFQKCEAAAMAELRGEWGRKETTALLVGSYIDAHFSDEMDEFLSEHPEIFTKQGELKADFKKADVAIERLERDELARMLLSGRHQVIKTVKIGGVWYKVKMDSLLTPAQVEAICKKFPEIRELVPFGGAIIVDLKYIRDFEPIWDDFAMDKVSFINYWGYDIQGAIYQKADKRCAPFVIVAVTKQDEPDLAAMSIPDNELSAWLGEIEDKSPRYAAIKRGEIEPIGCGRCAYCRSVKKLTKINNYLEV